MFLFFFFFFFSFSPFLVSSPFSSSSNIRSKHSHSHTNLIRISRRLLLLIQTRLWPLHLIHVRPARRQQMRRIPVPPHAHGPVRKLHKPQRQHRRARNRRQQRQEEHLTVLCRCS